MYRPCYVGGKKALFHRWSDYSQLVNAGALVGGFHAGTVKETRAIVEFEDGTVAEVEPAKLRFVTGKFEEYSFAERGKGK